MITASDLVAILPLIIVAGGSVVAMLAIAVRRNHALTAGLTLSTFVFALASMLLIVPAVPRAVTPLFVVDAFSLLFTAILLTGGIVIAILCHNYLSKLAARRDELYLLLLVAMTGAITGTSATHFLSLFLAIELLTIPLYAMIAYLPRRGEPLEAGMKYLVLAGASSAILLFGMALIYAESGTMEFAAIANAAVPGRSSAVWLAGFALLLTGFGFKLAIVPFHLWTADVYQGAPAPVTAFIASVSKGAMVALMFRLLHTTGQISVPAVSIGLAFLAIASMLGGNLLALLQTNLKRLLAYSSIAHLGYVLVAMQLTGLLAAPAVTFYMIAYIISVLIAFGIIGALSTPDGEPEDIDHYTGLFWYRPWLATLLTLAMLSLAGMPLTAGFIAKYYVVAAGAAVSAWLLLIVLVISSTIGLYYYLRVVVAVYSTGSLTVPLTQRLGPGPVVALGLLTACLVWLGIIPGSLIELLMATPGVGLR